MVHFQRSKFNAMVNELAIGKNIKWIWPKYKKNIFVTAYRIPTVPILPGSHVSQRCHSDNLAGKQLAHWLHWRDSEISSQTSFYTRNILFWGGRCQRISYKAGEEEAARSWKAWESHMERWPHWSNPQAWEWWRCYRKNFTYLSLVASLVVLIPITSTFSRESLQPGQVHHWNNRRERASRDTRASCNGTCE